MSSINHHSWLDELDLDPTSSPITMGVRNLGDRPWLLRDESFAADLELKASLCADRHHDVFAAKPDTEAAGTAVVELIREHGIDIAPNHDLHPLDNAGRNVQEDLCLMRRSDRGWLLDAGSVCFPSRWRLRDKLGGDLTQIHGPVPNYRSGLAAKVNALFDRLGERPVWRRNWFVHPDPTLFQPTRPADGDRFVPEEMALAGLTVRSERQTLRRLRPVPDWILFTIRTQQATIEELASSSDRREALAHYLRQAPRSVVEHRGISSAQTAVLVDALADHRSG